MECYSSAKFQYCSGIFFHSELAKYKEDVLTKSDNAKIKEEREKEKKKLVKEYVAYLTLN